VALTVFDVYALAPLPTEITNKNNKIIILLKVQLNLQLEQNVLSAEQLKVCF